MLLAIDVTKPLEKTADKLSYGGQMLLIGMSVVFAVLLLLWGALELFHLIVATIEGKRTKTEAPAPVQASENGSSDDESELIAVMAAAIAAASEENPEGSFRVVSFRRI